MFSMLLDPKLIPGWRAQGREASPGAPCVHLDLAQVGDTFVVNAEIAGVAKTDVKIHVEGRQLTISGEKKPAFELKEGNHFDHNEVGICF